MTATLPSAPVPSAAPVGEPLPALFDPSSVAVVGASDNRQKWGYWLARGALAGRHRRQVYLVNRRGGTVLGTRTWPSLDELPRVPELVVVTTPPGSVRQEVERGLAAGARCFVVITSRVAAPGTSDAAGTREELELAELVRSRGARLLGPNCMGVVDQAAALQLCWGTVPAGQVGLVSQSGNLGLEIGRLLGRVGHGLSRLVSLGNQRDIDAAEVLGSLALDEQTRIIAAYIEDFRDGRGLAQAIARARSAGKPVLVLAPGRSAAAGRAAKSHTGALVSPREVVQAALAEAGALLLDTPGQLADTAVTLLAPGMRPDRGALMARGHRVAVVADGGGQGVLAADTLAAAGLSVPPLGDLAVSRLTRTLPPSAGLTNPVDLAGAGESDIASYASVVSTLLNTDETDSVLLSGYFGDYASTSPQLTDAESAVAGALADAAEDAGRLVVVHTMASAQTPAIEVLRRRGIPVFDRVEHAAAAIAGAVRWSALCPTAPPTVPPRSAAPSALAAHQVPALDGGSYRRMRELLAGYGLSFPAARFVADADSAAAAAAAVGYPVVLKAMGLAHKTEASGVTLDIRDEPSLRTAFTVMQGRTGSAAFSVEAMVRYPGSVELIMGVRQDPAFGPVAMVGAGGVTAELLGDVVVGLAPLTRTRARWMLCSLRYAPYLSGWRGAEPIDLDAAADALTAIALAAAEHPEFSELEVNPVLAHPGGATALDAHGVPASQDRAGDRNG